MYGLVSNVCITITTSHGFITNLGILFINIRQTKLAIYERHTQKTN